MVRPRVAAPGRRLRVTGRSTAPTSNLTTTASSRCWVRPAIPTRTPPKTAALREAPSRLGRLAAAAAGGQLRATAGRPARARRAARRRRRTATCTACRAAPAACAASATSAATTARRTPSTTPTSPRPPTTARTCAPAARSRACTGSRGGGYEVRTWCTTRPTTVTRPPPAAAAAPDHLRPAGARRRHLRLDLPAAAQPDRLPGPEPGPRHAVQRQRRPAVLPVGRDRPRADGGRRRIEGSHGPVITGAIRVGDAVDEDGSTRPRPLRRGRRLPGVRRWLAEASQLPGQARRLAGSPRPAGPAARRVTEDRRLGGPQPTARRRAGSPTASLPLLGMGRDVPDGRDAPAQGPARGGLDDRHVGGYFDRVRAHMRAWPATSAPGSRTTRCGGPAG